MRRVNELDALVVAAKARADAAKARADAEKARADAAVRALDLDKRVLVHEKNWAEWLSAVVLDGVTFDSRVAIAPHHTVRHSSTSAANDDEFKLAAESMTTAVHDSDFWEGLPSVDAITVENACNAIRSKPAVAKHLFEAVHAAAPLADLHLYVEMDMTRVASTTRRTNLLFYVHSGTPPNSLNACVQRNGVCSIELQSVLDNEHDRLAMAELLRDFAHTVGQGIEATKGTFFGLMGDGVTWVATRWEVVMGSIAKPFRAVRSERFSLNLNDDVSLAAFVTRVLRLRAAAAQRMRHSTGWTMLAVVPAQDTSFIVERVLGVTDSCVVAQCVIETDRANRRTVALKIDRTTDKTHRCEKEAQVRERWLAMDSPPPPHIAVCTAVELYGARPVLQLETVGTVLEDMCLCAENVREELARVVCNDVLVALNWLHSLESPLAFVDLHPGNIVMCDGRAYLIDLESCSALGEPTQKPIREAFRTLDTTTNTPTQHTDKLGLMLVLAWIFDVDSFRSGIARLESREIGASQAATLLQKFASLDDFCSKMEIAVAV